MAFLTVLTIAITIFVLGIVSLVALNSQSAIHQVENDLEMVVYLKENISREESQKTGEEIGKLPEISSVTFISKDQALANIDKQLKESGTLKESLNGENPLPDAYKVKVTNAEKMDRAVQKIKILSAVSDVRYGEEVVRNVVKLSQSLKAILGIIIVLMILATIFLINSTISLTVSNRHEEIKIMSFVGATPFFIRTPFFFEGIVLGLIGSVLSVTCLYVGYGKLGESIRENLPFLPFFDHSNIVMMLFAFLVSIGILMGAIGSGYAVKKYLKI